MDIVMECESFVKDCDLLYGSYLTEKFMAVEGERMEKVKKAAHFAWEKIKELARKAVELLSRVAGAVSHFISKVIHTATGTPDVIEVDDAEAQRVQDFMRSDAVVVDVEWRDVVEVSEDIANAAENLAKSKSIAEDMHEKVTKICDDVDRLTEKLRAKSARAANDSFISLDTSSFAYAAMEAERKKIISIKAAKEKLLGSMKRSESAAKKTANVAKQVQNQVNQAANSADDGDTSKASLLGRLLGALNKLGSAIKEFFTKKAAAFRDLLSHARGPKSTVEEYNGPEPTVV